MSEQQAGLADDFDHFFTTVERRAYQMALFALRNPDDALEVVQDAMLCLVERYADKPAAQRYPLFYTILQSRIRDRLRRNSVRQRFGGLLPFLRQDGEEAPDPFQQAPDIHGHDPAQMQHRQETAQAIEQAVASLPYRQQQTFMLRVWEGLSTEDTARILECSEGTIKTHLSRALAALRQQLQDCQP